MDQAVHAQYELEPERLQQVLPDSPGVYCYKDPSGRIIYVGKAKNLRKRVLSYFRPGKDLTDKTALMMRRASGLDFILTATEKEAFILESSLIKKHMPRYNVVLRDDKQYPCLRLDTNERYPRLRIVRKIKKDGALYFGPFSSAGAVRSTQRIIDRVFKLRKCKGRGLPKRTRPCLNYQMGRCLGPCTVDVPAEAYDEIVQQVRLLLDGRNRELISRFREDMEKAAQGLDFEKAAAIRDQIRAVEKTVERQHVVSKRLENQDIIGLSQKENACQVVILFVRKGYVVGSRDYFFKGQGGSPSEVMESVVKQYYSREVFIPDKIFLSETIEDLESISEWLGDQSGKKVVIHRPLKGEKLRLVKMAVANAESILATRTGSLEVDLADRVQEYFNLKRPPRVIEGLDISNLHGEMAVGTIVSFVDGLPHKAGYRNYRIKEIDGIDDYGMMTELVERRISQGQLPDLFLVDGGKGHLSSVRAVVDRLGTDIIDVASIAKADENRHEKTDKIYLSDRKNPLNLRADDPVLLLMMRIRDEAHRRAVSYHRRIRSKSLTSSELDQIPGIGVKRRNLLLNHFGDVQSVSEATTDSLLEVPGISKELAQNIQAFFRRIDPSTKRQEI